MCVCVHLCVYLCNSLLVRACATWQAAMRATRLMVVTIILSHSLACGWFFCHIMAEEGDHTWWDKCVVYPRLSTCAVVTGVFMLC